MRMPWLLLPLFLFGCATAPQAPPTVRETGREVHRLTVAGRTRLYELHLPPPPQPGRPYPVVFAFHGAGSTIESLARASGFDALASRDGVAVVYPQGIGSRFDTRRGSDDVRFVRSILDDLDGRVGIDRRRVHASGFSNGAFLCYRLVADLPGVFASIAPVAGLMAQDALPAPGTTTSLLHIHGSSDRVVSGTGRSGSLGAHAGAQAWAERAGCGAVQPTRRVRAAAPLRVTESRYACPAGVRVAVLSIEGKGHTWPQEAQGWLSREIWKFFESR